MVLWVRDVSLKILMALMSVSRTKVSLKRHLVYKYFLVVASAERLRQAAAASLGPVYTAGTNVLVGALIIILATALAALVFTKRRNRNKIRKIEEIRSVS